MKVLIISAVTFNFSPSGPAYIAGAVRAAGHQVEVFDCRFAGPIQTSLSEHLARFQPDVIGLSIRTVAGSFRTGEGEFGMQPFDSRLLVKEVVDCIKQHSTAPVIPGGPGFNYFGPEWLDYLDLDYGLRGEADFSFPEYLSRFAAGMDVYNLPGCVYRREGRFHQVPRQRISNLDETAFPAYDLFNLDQYVRNNIAAGISTRRGCAFQCTYCPYSSLEGLRYRLKSPARVVDEMESILRANPSLQIEFCDNCFNFPLEPTLGICREIIRRGRAVNWKTIDLKPIGITPEFLGLLRDSGCRELSLDIASASDRMLRYMHRGFTAEQVKQSLTTLSSSGIPYSVGLLLGAPGETPQTIDETLAVIDSLAVPRLSVTIGINLWTHHQPLTAELARHNELPPDEKLFDEIRYISPELPPDYMLKLIETLQARPNCALFVFKPYADYRRK